MQPIEFDITKQLDTFNKLHNDMPFLISKALNDVAFDRARKDVSKQIQKNMTNRDKYFNSIRAIKIRRSNKNNLRAEIYHFKEQMGLQQHGGVETPKGKKLAVPIRRNLSKYAGVPNNKKIHKALTIDTIMNKAPKRQGEPIYRTRGVEPFVLNRGVFIRTNEGLRLLYSFVEKAEHNKKLLKMQQIIERTYNVNFERFLERNYLRALKG